MKNKGIILVLIAAFISGFSIFINSYAQKGINPFVFTFLKNISVGTAVLFLMLATLNFKKLIEEGKKYWWILLSISIIGGSIPFLLFFKGLSLTSASSGGFIQKMLFLFSCIFAIIFLKEKVNKSIYITGILLIIGNMIALNYIPGNSLNGGDLMILGATIFWAVENTISKKILSNVSVNTLLFFRMFIGAILMVPFLIIDGDMKFISSLQNTQINWIVITSLILLAYVLFWYNGLKETKLSTASILLVIASPITTTLSFAYTKKIPNTNSNLGNLILFLSIAAFIIYEKYNNKINSYFLSILKREKYDTQSE